MPKQWWSNDSLDPSEAEEEQKRITRVWHHYKKWEDARSGMYSTVTGAERKRVLLEAIQFTGDHALYGSYMMIIIDRWPISCEHNLTALCINRRAWIGHAACCYAINCPEDITREAWGHLSSRQRKLANYQADFAIKMWEDAYLQRTNAKDSTGAKRPRGGKGEGIYNVRPVQQSIFELLGRQRQHSDASPGS